MTGKTAIITGGGSGIGAATATAMAKVGVKILLVDVVEAAAKSLAEKLRSEGGQCELFKADVSNEASVIQYVQRAIEWSGKIDIFVNNAGIEGSVHPMAEYALSIKTILNKEVVQDWNTNDMIFDVPTLVEFLSGSTTLLPGTVILTGTPQGVGMAAKPPRWLKPGDTVTIAIESIGDLTNPVVLEK